MRVPLDPQSLTSLTLSQEMLNGEPPYAQVTPEVCLATIKDREQCTPSRFISESASDTLRGYLASVLNVDASCRPSAEVLLQVSLCFTPLGHVSKRPRILA